MPTRRAQRVLTLFCLAFLTSVPAFAHHEAMFGPQSSAVLSPGAFLSGQVFGRQNGKDDEKRHETTTVLSAGLTPFKKPLSIALVVPLTFATSLNGAATRGFEDSLISARYRLDAQGLADRLGLDQSYVMGVGGLEIPTGTLEHDFGKGPVGEIAAGVFSAEKRPIGAIAYAYYHHTGFHHGSQITPGNLFAGGGIAYTPIDNEAKGKLFSMQLGLSHEQTFKVEQDGVKRRDSGASGTFLHPGLVFSTNPQFQFFVLVSIPLAQEWNALSDRQRFRLGTGVIWILNHSGT